MAISHKQRYPLATSTFHYTLPKPYRRKRFVDDAPGRSRLRMAGLTLAGLTVAGLLGALLVLARENFDAPPVPIVAAPRPAPAPALPTPAAVATAPAAAERPAVPVRKPAPPVHAARFPARAVRLARPVASPAPAVPDPDVDLISAILILTPRPEPVDMPDLAP